VQKYTSAQGTRKYIVDTAGDLATILMELDADDNMLIKKTYVYGGTGQILAQHTGGGTSSRYFYLHDRLGSVRLIIDTSGNVKNRYTYQPFGKLFASETEENILNPFKFTGQWLDSEFGWYYLRARMYAPVLGRFTSRDLIWGDYDQPLTLHKYLYCTNDPVNKFDPTGLDAYLLWDPEGGPDFFGDPWFGHVDVAVDLPDGSVLVGGASWFGLDRPVPMESLYRASSYGKKVVMRFKTQSLSWWEPGENSDTRVFDFITQGMGEGTIASWWCSTFAQQSLAYGGYQLGLINGIFPQWLWESAVWMSKYNDNVSIVTFDEK
jgi:RHS repeat-associated protein